MLSKKKKTLPHQTKRWGPLKNKKYGWLLYKKYYDIISRCENPRSTSYKDYGSRGVSMCKEWRTNIHSFYEWAIKNGFKPGLTIDRVNVHKGYSPKNCRFITKSEQSSNRRHHISYRGEIASEAERRLKLKRGSIHARLKNGFTLKKAFNTPLIRVPLIYNKETSSQAERRLNLKRGTIHCRIKYYGWSKKRAFSTTGTTQEN